MDTLPASTCLAPSGMPLQQAHVLSQRDVRNTPPCTQINHKGLRESCSRPEEHST